MNANEVNDLHNWIPWRLVNPVQEGLCEWLYLGDKEFTEPFFEDTLAACRRTMHISRRYKVVSGLEVLAPWAETIDTAAPAAFIFHVSRCGSTLLTQLLGCDPANITLPEVPFFDEILRLPFKQPQVDAALTGKYLEAALRFYGQKRKSGQERVFVKTDSWHLHFYEQLRVLYPSIPFILLYRHPLEVLASQRKQRGWQSVPGLIEPQVFGLSAAQAAELNPDRHMAHVLAFYFEKILRIMENDPLAFAFDYAGGIRPVVEKIYGFLGLPIEKALEEKWIQRSGFHAKRPNEPFGEEGKQSVIPDYLEPAFVLYQKSKALTKPSNPVR